jgi:hypothetical protein
VSSIARVTPIHATTGPSNSWGRQEAAQAECAGRTAVIYVLMLPMIRLLGSYSGETSGP